MDIRPGHHVMIEENYPDEYSTQDNYQLFRLKEGKKGNIEVHYNAIIMNQKKDENSSTINNNALFNRMFFSYDYASRQNNMLKDLKNMAIEEQKKIDAENQKNN